MLKNDEGYMDKPYLDSVNKLTWGYGRNLDDKPITKEEIKWAMDEFQNVAQAFTETNYTKESGEKLLSMLSGYEAGVFAEYLLEENIFEVLGWLKPLDFWETLSENRKAVIANMAYNMGNFIPTWPQTIKMIKAGCYHEASKMMLDTLWHKQVGGRAEYLSEIMDSDILPNWLKKRIG
jgi:lysozyme